MYYTLHIRFFHFCPISTSSLCISPPHPLEMEIWWQRSENNEADLWFGQACQFHWHVEYGDEHALA